MLKTLAGLFASALLLTAQTTLVPVGATWKYLDNGSNQGTAWRGSAFVDTSWAAGPAELGYGDGGEATVVSFGPNSSAKYITTYFRHSFNVTNPAAFVSLSLRVKRDDGVVVYINGVEAWRDNMPAGAPAYTTLASTAVADDGATFVQSTISPSLLVTGTNVIAAEIHQSGGTSSDISFDLELTGSASTTVTRGPYLQLGTPTGLVVRWRTSAATDSAVRYGASPASLTSVATDAASTTEHIVPLTGLLPDTRYYYSVGSTSATIAGGDASHTFITGPANERPTRIWVLGDSGTANASAAAVRDAYTTFAGTRYTDLWLMLGDNAYNSGTDAEYQTAVFNMYPSTLRQSVLWSTIGNHDTASSSNPPASLPYFQLFTLPMSAEAGGVASGTEKYYSFNYGNMHFVCLDSMSSSRAAGSAMLTWLQNDLASNTKEWLIAFWHHPPYTKGSHDSDTESNLIEMRANVLPILESFGVDLVMTGHSHSYERSFLIDGHYGTSGTFNASMKLNGGSGRETETGAYTKPAGLSSHAGAVYAVAGSSGQASGGLLNHPAMFISLNNLGSMVLDVDGSRLDAKFLRENGTIADSFTILKPAGTPNTPPTVSITSPASGATFTAPASITIDASAADSDGTVTQVDFYQGAALLGTDTTAPFSFTWTGVASGIYSLTAKATDNLGAATTSSPVSVTVSGGTPVTLVPAGAAWKYLANGSNQGTAWRALAFNDAAWLSGPAQLGYGDGDEATVVSYGPNAKKKYITTYFRKAFTASGPAGLSGLRLRLLRDDGAVIYLNGSEIVRSNMPAGTFNFNTVASTVVDGAAESTFNEFTISPSLLINGTNVIAVEIHQQSKSSSDISFNLELITIP